jgi:hypothetical protein
MPLRSNNVRSESVLGLPGVVGRQHSITWRWNLLDAIMLGILAAI